MKPTTSAVKQLLPAKLPPQRSRAQMEKYVRTTARIRARLLIALRKHLGLTHEQVAERAKISPSTVRTQEAAGPRCGIADLMLICERGLGFNAVLLLAEMDRRYEEEEKDPDLRGPKPWSEAQIIKLCCTGKTPLLPAAEARRQLRLMRQLTLPARPGPPARKRPAAKKTKKKTPASRRKKPAKKRN